MVFREYIVDIMKHDEPIIGSPSYTSSHTYNSQRPNCAFPALENYSVHGAVYPYPTGLQMDQKPTGNAFSLDAATDFESAGSDKPESN